MFVRSRHARAEDDRGAGLISTTLGFLFFLIFLLFAAQTLVGLYATTAISAAGYDAARVVATTGDAGQGQARFDALRGGYDASISFSRQGENIVATINGTNPTFLPESFAPALPFVSVDRQITIRVEEFVGE